MDSIGSDLFIRIARFNIIIPPFQPMTMTMDGDEEPTWASSAPAAEQASTGAPSSSVSAGLADTTKASSKVAKDNIAGSILGSMNATKKTKEITAAAAAANQGEEQDLTKTILFMRVLNMGAAVLLVTCSVSFCSRGRQYFQH